MKVKILLMSLVMLLGSFVAVNAQNAKAKKSTATTTFNVGMHCESCKARIEKNISWEKGVKDLSVNLEKLTVTVTYDPGKTDKAKLQAAFEKLGYSCSEYDANKPAPKAAGGCPT